MRKFGTHKFIYDSWNRIQSMTYPDGEVVTYTYDRGGLLHGVQGRKGMDDRTYVENITYNTYGLKESVLYGNGTYTEYQYDLLMRLSHLHSETGQGEAMQGIDYVYDHVGNITDIANSAVTLSNGLGGSYYSHYDYDPLYRLSHAEGNWNGGQLNYLLDMEYHSNGRIERKNLYAEVMDHTGATSVTDYANGYLYNGGQPNTLEYVVDDFSGWQQIFTWDAAGNMTNHENFAEGCARHLCWDEENRLVSFADCENAGFYQYDANGERTYKLAGGIAMQNIQGHWRSYNLLDNPTLYTSPYLVATPKGYTKHYYAESERVASMIGSGGWGDITRTIVNMEDFLTDFWVGEDGLRWEEVWIPEFYEAKHEEFRNHLTDVMTCAGADPIVEDNLLVELRTYWQYIQDEGEHECYWYHPDHLGSSSWITFSDGEAIQHLHYLPWGENFVDQRSSTFDGARFTFSAKEKDQETGFSYFGSRYYSSDLSIWLSVDPQASKYPHQSNYVYCSNNPIKVVDPNGEDEWEVNEVGNIRCIHNDKPDRLYAVSGTQKGEWGERKLDVKPLDVDKSIMNTIQSRDENTSFSAMNNREQVDNLFDFLADNTNVEWTQISTHDAQGDNFDYLTTSHDNLKTELLPIHSTGLVNAASQGFLDVFKHSHSNKYTGDNYYVSSIYPLSSNIRSGGDLRTKDMLIQKNGFVRCQPSFVLRNGGKNYAY